MIEKNMEKLKRKNRKTWEGLYTRKTPTKKELLDKQNKKDKNNRTHENYTETEVTPTK